MLSTDSLTEANDKSRSENLCGLRFDRARYCCEQMGVCKNQISSKRCKYCRELSRGWFTGDTFGVSYPMMKSNKGRFVFPTTSPVQFDPELLKASIKLMMSYNPERMYLTHYGVVEVNEDISDGLCKQINDYVTLLNTLYAESVDKNINTEQVIEKLTKYTLAAIIEHGCTVSEKKLTEIINMDIKLNSQGLIVWYQRKLKKAQMA